jgi:hypothetical protein
MELLNIRTGKSLCKRAVVEVDNDKLKSRVGAAETAIFNRLQAISRSSDHAAERQAIADALALIRILKRDALDFPEWEILWRAKTSIVKCNLAAKPQCDKACKWCTRKAARESEGALLEFEISSWGCAKLFSEHRYERTGAAITCVQGGSRHFCSRSQ